MSQFEEMSNKNYNMNTLNKDKEYWVRKFSGNIENVSIPFDFNNDEIFTDNRDEHKFLLDKDSVDGINKLCGDSDQKLHVVLLAGIVALLHKYTDSDNIIIGTPIDKQEVELEFINTMLPLKFECTKDISFKDLIIQSKDVLIEAIDHQNYPLSSLLKNLGISNENETGQLFDLVVILKNIQDKSYLRSTKANIVCSFERINSRIECELDYNKNVYHRNSIINFEKRLSILLKKVLLELNLAIKDVDLLTEEERINLTLNNRTESENITEKGIYDLIKEKAILFPDNIALTEGEKEIRYSELLPKIDSFAQILYDLDIRRGDIVAIYMNNSIDVIYSILGILKAGAVYLPIDVNLPKERVKFILDDSRAKRILSDSDNFSKLDGISNVIHIKNLLNEGNNSSENNISYTFYPNDLAYIIYTSGSTGKPKGVAIEHKSLLNYITWAVRKYVRDGKLSFPLYTSLSFDLTVTSIFAPLVTANNIIIYREKKDENLLDKIVEDNKIDIIKLTPSHLKLIKISEVLTDKKNKQKLKTIIVGGEEFSCKLAREIYELFEEEVDIYNEYGPTEATVGCMIYKYNYHEDSLQSVSIGQPIDNMQIYILDKYLNLIFPGRNGELYLSGTGLAREYINNRELSEKKFNTITSISKQILYQTGDIVKWNTQGDHIYVGRTDEQVKINGFRIEIPEIQFQLLAINGIEEAVVINKQINNSDQLIAYFVSKEEISKEEIQIKLKQFIPEYMVPHYYVKLDKIPLTNNGKIDKNKLPDVQLFNSDEYVGPKTEIEKILVNIWSDVLEIEDDKISVTKSFFDLGGHSLKAVFLISRIRKAVDIELSLGELFKNTTIQQLAQVITVSKLMYDNNQAEEGEKIII